MQQIVQQSQITSSNQAAVVSSTQQMPAVSNTFSTQQIPAVSNSYSTQQMTAVNNGSTQLASHAVSNGSAQLASPVSNGSMQDVSAASTVFADDLGKRGFNFSVIKHSRFEREVALKKFSSHLVNTRSKYT